MSLDQRVWKLLRARDSRPRPTAFQPSKLSIVDYDGGPSELLLYMEIGYWGITAQDVADQLQGRRGDLHVRINSPGGDVFDGYAIYNMLVAYDGAVTVTVEGLAASAASFIAMSGDTVEMCLASQMMIHDASGVCMGNAAEMREWADVLDSISETIATVYAERGDSDAGEWRAIMQAERWYSPQQAVDAGLADTIVTPNRVAKPPVEPDGTGPDETGPSMVALPAVAVAAVATEPEPVVEPVVESEPVLEPEPTLPALTVSTTTSDTSTTSDTWQAMFAGLLQPAPSTADELLNALVQKGNTR
jgi:ATP-dependent protease ClpP protease subunit